MLQNYNAEIYSLKDEIEFEPVEVTDRVKFQYCRDLFSVHSGNILLPPCILCPNDIRDHKHASKHDF